MKTEPGAPALGPSSPELNGIQLNAARLLDGDVGKMHVKIRWAEQLRISVKTVLSQFKVVDRVAF
ncbi:hypothetical protein QF001_005488 [Paraburkholderia youngii]|uniref:hypothetical protein n=1 Tax=Paraburkholderia youngii TaxID=2782701 RepID=UPI003D1DD3A6